MRLPLSCGGRAVVVADLWPRHQLQHRPPNGRSWGHTSWASCGRGGFVMQWHTLLSVLEWRGRLFLWRLDRDTFNHIVKGKFTALLHDANSLRAQIKNMPYIYQYIYTYTNIYIYMNIFRITRFRSISRILD